MNLLRAATLTTTHLAATVQRYIDWLDYTPVEQGIVSPDLAASWGAPASAGRAYQVLRPASGADAYLRFIEGPFVPEYTPLRHYGWAAVEICNQDTLAVNARMERSPFDIIGPPKRIPGVDAIFPMQIMGGDGEIVYLTQIQSDPPAPGLPQAQSLIDRIFILVLACSDMQATARWFGETLRLDRGQDWTIEYSMIANAFGLPLSQHHTITVMTHGGDTFLELDQYPPQTTPRPAAPGALPPGCAMCTIFHPEWDAIARSADWIAPPQRRSGPIYQGGRVGTLRDPDGALIEIVEVV
jgi:catechol 2,3-dioxygenase-like lactoylglutathione lyase family enzyme